MKTCLVFIVEDGKWDLRSVFNDEESADRFAAFIDGPNTDVKVMVLDECASLMLVNHVAMYLAAQR